MTTIFALLYNLAILAGCSYIVFWLGHSGWWFVLALGCLATGKSK